MREFDIVGNTRIDNQTRPSSQHQIRYFDIAVRFVNNRGTEMLSVITQFNKKENHYISSQGI